MTVAWHGGVESGTGTEDNLRFRELGLAWREDDFSGPEEIVVATDSSSEGEERSDWREETTEDPVEGMRSKVASMRHSF